ncbi:hypothetical protein EVAR_92621_1 [Eumeta japonica]|uniref:Uncharacterized protein n=1 Tax=Eumeta variegata TaxID=151549 RepID=A0A4C1SWU8_EUMVA|nr:hypothetical protein EVAR_92621_1 [Eumeta japonica]
MISDGEESRPLELSLIGSNTAAARDRPGRSLTKEVEIITRSRRRSERPPPASAVTGRNRHETGVKLEVSAVNTQAAAAPQWGLIGATGGRRRWR